MAKAIIRTGAPSRSDELSEQFQEIQAWQARNAAARNAQQSRMWYDAVSGGIGNLADAARTGITAKYEEREREGREERANREYRSRLRDMLALESGFEDWESAQSAVRPGQTIPELFAERKAAAEGIRDSARFDREIIQRAATQSLDKFLDPVVVPPDLQRIIDSDRQLGETFWKAKEGLSLLEAELRSPRPKADFTRILSMMQPHKQAIADVMRVAAESRPNPQKRFEEAIVTEPVTGQRYIPHGMFDQIETDRETPEIVFDREMQKAVLSGDEAKVRAMAAARKIQTQAQVDSQIVTIDGRKMFAKPDSKGRNIAGLEPIDEEPDKGMSLGERKEILDIADEIREKMITERQTAFEMQLGPTGGWLTRGLTDEQKKQKIAENNAKLNADPEIRRAAIREARKRFAEPSDIDKPQAAQPVAAPQEPKAVKDALMQKRASGQPLTPEDIAALERAIEQLSQE